MLNIDKCIHNLNIVYGVLFFCIYKFGFGYTVRNFASIKIEVLKNIKKEILKFRKISYDSEKTISRMIHI